MIGKIIETVAVVVANAAIRVIDAMQERRDKRPELAPPLDNLKINDMVARARADMEARRKAEGKQ